MSEHSWCRDVPRDEAVRAAEDGREESLPTLAQAISRAGQFAPPEPPQGAKCTERDSVTNRRPVEPGGGGNVTPFAEQAKRSAAVSETGEVQSGLRTERVTLEVKHDCKYPAAEWVLEVVQEACSDPGESVRVVEEMPAFAPATAIAGGTVLVNGQDMVTLVEFLRHTTRLTQEAGVAKAERDAAIRERDELRAECERLRGKVAAMEGQSRMDIEREIAVEEAWESCDIRPHWPDDEPGTSHRYAESMRLEIVRLRSRVAELEEQLESVACRAATAETALESAPAASGAANSPEEPKSAEPVAYWVHWKSDTVIDKWTFQSTFPTREAAAEYIDEQDQEDDQPEIVPFYASPPPARVWLTANERAAIESARDHFAAPEHDDDECVFVAAALRSLLARSSPPEVVLPPAAKGETPLVRDLMWGQAIRAAGVKVKEPLPPGPEANG